MQKDLKQRSTVQSKSSGVRFADEDRLCHARKREVGIVYRCKEQSLRLAARLAEREKKKRSHDCW